MTAVLEVRGVRVTRGGRTLLDGVDLTVEAGERVALVGPSGSGKSTLLSVVAGLLGPDAGEVLLDGRPAAGVAATSGGRVGLVLQGYGLVALLTAAENVELALVAGAGVAPAEAAERARAALDVVDLADRAEHLVEELSGGQQQRVSVARALAVRPHLLLADEPAAEQDRAHREAARSAILGAADHGAAVLYATHDPEDAARCDRVLELRDGRLGPVHP